ncbi:MAG: hypothetical protein V1927_02705 [Candidatus Omnitrophota bacterium]
MMFASQYEYEQARQIDENAESRLKQIEDKSKMIEELEKEYNILYTEFINKICDLSAFLNRYNLDSRVLFPNLSREIQKENSKT